MMLSLLLFLFSFIGILFTLIVGKIIIWPIVRYNLLRSQYSHIPRNHGRQLLLPLLHFALPDGYLNFMWALKDSSGKTLPLVHFGPEMDGTHKVAVTDPQSIHDILMNESKFMKLPNLYDAVKVLSGDGILNSHGETWKAQRRILTPLFHFGSLKNMISSMGEEAQKFVDDLAQRKGEPVVLADVMNDLSLSMIVKLGFGGDFDVKWMKKEWMNVLDRFTAYLAFYGVFGEYSRNLPWNWKFMNSIQKIREKVQEKINQRREQGSQVTDLLSLMLSVKDEETGQALSDKLIIDNSITFLLAGQDTTSSLMSWVVYFLWKHPEVLQKVRNEVETEVGGEMPNENTLGKLKYCKQVLEETLRIKSPVPHLSRVSIEDCKILGYDIPKGTSIDAYFGASHIDQSIWDKPEEFNPDRFSDEAKNSHKRHTFSYLPFSGGPRNCIGQKFAMQEAIITLAVLVRKFDFVIDPQEKFQHLYKATLIPGTLHARFVERV